MILPAPVGGMADNSIFAEGLKKDDKTLMKPSELADDDIKASVAYLRTFKK
jgi:hypothetical protein